MPGELPEVGVGVFEIGKLIYRVEPCLAQAVVLLALIGRPRASIRVRKSDHLGKASANHL